MQYTINDLKRIKQASTTVINNTDSNTEYLTDGKKTISLMNTIIDLADEIIILKEQLNATNK